MAVRADVRVRTADDVRCWSANGFFWSGNFGMALGATLSKGGSLVLQSMFDAAEALALMQRERVNFPVAWPHQWAQLEAAPNWAGADLSAMRFVDNSTPIARHPSVSVDYREPGHAYGNTETFTISTAYPANTPPDDVTAGSSGGAAARRHRQGRRAPPLGNSRPDRRQRRNLRQGTDIDARVSRRAVVRDARRRGFFHTGDGGHLDADGRLFWEGRLNDIIKTGGANVSPRSKWTRR